MLNNCTGFSAEFFGSQSVEKFCFAGANYLSGSLFLDNYDFTVLQLIFIKISVLL